MTQEKRTVLRAKRNLEVGEEMLQKSMRDLRNSVRTEKLARLAAYRERLKK